MSRQWALHPLHRKLATGSWPRRFMDLAELVAGWSKDRSTKVGAVVVGPDMEIRSVGFNGFPRGVDDGPDSRHARPDKYRWTEHAERNAVYNAARFGAPLRSCALFCTHMTCADCARAVIQSGLLAVVHLPVEPGLAERFAEDFLVAREMYAEAGVAVAELEPVPPGFAHVGDGPPPDLGWRLVERLRE